MTRLDHLSYCSVCINRLKTREEGYICKLTNKVADFENLCPSFDIDKEEKSKIIKGYSGKIEESVKNQSKWAKKLFRNDPILQYLVAPATNKVIDRQVLEKEKVIFEHRKSKWQFLIVSLVIIVGLVKGLYDGQFHNLSKWSLMFLVFLTLLPVYFIYFFIFNPEIMRISKLGIIVGKKDFIP